VSEVAARSGEEGPDVVTWVPTSPARRRSRGFDQAELLARRVARRLDIAARPLLVHDAGAPQTGRSAAERRIGPPLAVRRHARVPPHVLLVDDVVTTGATLSAAARALRRAGATQVSAVAAARTPLRLNAIHPYTAACTARGSVVASRCQSQAKRPT
jgi:predicted amidophosphoribosyltransferase